MWTLVTILLTAYASEYIGTHILVGLYEKYLEYCELREVRANMEWYRQFAEDSDFTIGCVSFLTGIGVLQVILTIDWKVYLGYLILLAHRVAWAETKDWLRKA